MYGGSTTIGGLSTTGGPGMSQQMMSSGRADGNKKHEDARELVERFMDLKENYRVFIDAENEDLEEGD